MSKEAAMATIQASIDSGEEVVSDWMTVDQERINQFAEATGDHQWIHVDAERAKKESPYKDTIAHGYLTLSLIPALSGSLPNARNSIQGVKMGVNYGCNKVRFPAPVMVNSKVRARAKYKEVTEVPGGLQAVREMTIEVEGGDKPVCVAETVSRMYF